MKAKEIGMRLAELREAKGQTKRFVAREMGVSYSSYCQWEYGIKVPGDDAKIKIARYFGVTVGSLFYAE